MARSGLYKSDVKKARDALLTQNRHPSVDAVRIALGNTGSKTTIHKYLKELEEEEGGAGGRRASISEALQDLVERLAAQLQDDASTKIDEFQAQAAKKAQQQADLLAAANQQIASLNSQLQQTEERLQQEAAAHALMHEALHKESIARHTAEQQVGDLKERLQENENHRRSLEDKHHHAREALEHYRNSVKEQREQDARRHEQQVQQLQAEIRTLQQSLVVKQDDVTRLNQEGAKLVANLSHTKQALHERDTQLRQLQQKLDAAQGFAERSRMLEAQLAAQSEQANALTIQLTEANGKTQNLLVELATAQATLEAQQSIAAELRALLEQTRTAQAAASGEAAR